MQKANTHSNVFNLKCMVLCIAAICFFNVLNNMTGVGSGSARPKEDAAAQLIRMKNAYAHEVELRCNSSDVTSLFAGKNALTWTYEHEEKLGADRVF